ncbi:hypothetical protein RCL_jg3247.t1 [Rhizophagus clarus]|uniref:Uncharacterized protein n=1 Tax=Rhizophagus clarus TaxID=94130 RepID=A0A8H3M9R1_9GLOM|nr:hypothetical protein RCL_jg3247.t1 [Rhizophagus clarus]
MLSSNYLRHSQRHRGMRARHRRMRHRRYGPINNFDMLRLIEDLPRQNITDRDTFADQLFNGSPFLLK